MWAMELRRPDGFEWSLEQKLDMIIGAGFDGAGVRFSDRVHVRDVTRRLRDAGLTWQAQCYPCTVDALRPVLDLVGEFGADHINLQADIRPHTIDECVPLIDGWRQLAHDAGVALHLETHRDRMTTDLHFTLHLLDRCPDLRLTGDLSHYLVGREFAWPITEENHRLMRRIIDNCWGFHGPVASREQIQVQIGFPHQRHWLDLFMGWWEYGFTHWRSMAPQDACLTFLCELGPREYAMTDGNGHELSDRWQEAQSLMRLVRGLWQATNTHDPESACPTHDTDRQPANVPTPSIHPETGYGPPDTPKETRHA